MIEHWEPRTEADVRSAITQGLVRESHVFDFKKAPPPPARNVDIAIDLANFAVDGGRILFGVHQRQSTGPCELAPFDLSGLPERLDQIARGGLIDPPLRIRCTEIPSESDTSKGYLLVIVPPSSVAPHQVDGRYRYRSDRTNAVPSDHEVRRLIAERMARGVDLAELLSEEVSRDPTDPSLRTQGHLFMLAQPLYAAGDLLARTFPSPDWRRWLQEDFQQRVIAVPYGGGGPDLFGDAQTLSARVVGWAVSTFQIASGRTIRPNGVYPATEDQLLDLEVRDDGGLRLFCGRASFRWTDDSYVINISLIVRLARRLIRAAAAVSARTGFQGEWGFALAIRGIGEASIDLGPIAGLNARRVDAYDQVTTASADVVDADPDIVAYHLLSRFFRGLGFIGQIPGLESVEVAS